MEIVVKSVGEIEPKGVQELEKELLEKHEQEKNASEEAAKEAARLAEEQAAKDEASKNTNSDEELSEEKVLSFLGKRYNKQINSLDELTTQREDNEQIPEDVAAYMKYKKETGRGFDDFRKLNEDFENMDQDTLLKSYLTATQEGLDAEDIKVMMEDYSFDESMDDESKIKKVKLEKKKIIAEAKKFFNNQKEKYSVPIESRKVVIPDDEKEEFESYKQYISKAKTIEEETNRKRRWFDEKTNDVFDNGFKGFEFSIDDKVKLTFNPGEAAEIKKSQNTPMNLINKFMDEKTGMIKDAPGYHRALAVAMNPEKFAKFFYEQGKADASESEIKGIKNINMTERKAPEASSKSEVKVKAVNPDSGNGLKIRVIK